MTAQHHGRRAPERRTPGGTPLAEYGRFFRTALRSPTTVGAATPTSQVVGRTVAQVVPRSGAPVVVELGPGTGSLSGAIHHRLPGAGRHIGIELDEGLVRHLRTNYPRMETVHADARDLRGVLDRLGVEAADVIVTSIPWSLLPENAQGDILRQCHEALTPAGVFTALTYLPMQHTPTGRRFGTRLHSDFDEVLTHVTWRNLPPILHYTCRRPLVTNEG
ncbi:MULTISPECIES: methyltransferase domain-containing protein [unclassified Actinopolyspora]|uniref:methyltransferase domain-containing protein n=1 Tax=unclassified Actinopolyspora TaxID=2639451 RepID=UPI0013F5E8A9|nr:methyltransferase domain-containing protein [Actinopolyspora sp. BKK2]NHE75515.1 methyltransferase domain-containing protein [Actinopolyspora sp. BKK1]